MLKYLILFIVTGVFSFILTPLARSAAFKLGAIDLPGKRKVHSKPTPRLGGFPIFIAFHLVLLLSSQFEFFFFPPNFFKEINFGWLFAASAIVFGLGAVDDFRKLPPGIKFLFQAIAGLMAALTCCKIEVISLPFGSVSLGIWSIPATVFWIVAITNAINLLDGLDGLAGGTSLIVCFAIFGISLFNQHIGVALVSIILAGGILGFLRYNFHPASIFLGDSGAYFLGFILSIFSLISSVKGTTTIAILLPILALGLPIIDTVLSMLRRLLKSFHIVEVDEEKNLVKFFFRNGWSMFKADRGHIHHRLLQIGFTHRKAVIFLYVISVILGALAFSSAYFKNINYALFLTAIVIGFGIGVMKLGYAEIQVLSKGALLPLFELPIVNQRILRVFVDMAIISFSYYVAMMLRFEGEFSPQAKDYYLSTLPLVLVMRIICFHFNGLYKGAWRYMGVEDMISVLKAVVLGCMISTLVLWMIPGLGIMSWSVIVIDFNLLLLLVIGVRGSYKILAYFNVSLDPQGRQVLIYGVGREGVDALKELTDSPSLGLSPIGFIDDDDRNRGKKIKGYPVLGTLDSLESLLEKHSITEIIVSGEDLPKEKLDHLSQICQVRGITLHRFQKSLKEVPPSGKTL